MTAPFVFFGKPMIWAVISFVCWGVVALSVYAALQLVGWTRANAFWASLLTSALPLNQARFALAMTPYAISAASFAIAIVLLTISVRLHRSWLRLPVAILLLLSFSTNSFLTMFWLAPAAVYLTVRHLDPLHRTWPAIRSSLLHVELFVLPVAYWISKALFQQTYGLYTNYNKFQMGPIEGVLTTLLKLVRLAPDFPVFFPTPSHAYEAAAIAIGVLIIVVVTIRRTRTDIAVEQGTRSTNWLLVAGLFAAAITALFPYVIVGIDPRYHGLWETRHTTTLAIVGGMLVFAVLRAVLPGRFVPAGSLTVLGFFVAVDVSASRQLLGDVYESNAIVHSPTIAAIPPGTMIGLIEDDNAYRMFGRHFTFYDASSMLNAHADTDSLIAQSQFEIIDPATGDYVRTGSPAFPPAVARICRNAVNMPQYGFGDVVSNGLFYEVSLRPKSDPPSFISGLGIAFGLLFDHQNTVAKAVSNLDVIVVPRPLGEEECGHAVQN
ncbi:MAG: hypothetical protein MO846_11790 [Candidatus Devosia symbiotica]|nr:hypothetical protein [Candidatus Devosia symbiotica]